MKRFLMGLALAAAISVPPAAAGYNQQLADWIKRAETDKAFAAMVREESAANPGIWPLAVLLAAKPDGMTLAAYMEMIDSNADSGGDDSEDGDG